MTAQIADAYVTAGANTALALGLVMLAIGCRYAKKRLDGQLEEDVITLLCSVQVACLAVAVHRLFWNAAIWFAPAGEMHSAVISQWRGEVTLAIVALLWWQGFRGLAPFLAVWCPRCWPRVSMVLAAALLIGGSAALVDIL